MSERCVTVFYHGDCQDGFGAAWCARRRYGDAADYQPMHYGDAWPAALIDGREIFILDFSADHATVREMAGRAKGLLLLDHHATPCRDWQDLLHDDAGLGLMRHDEPELALTVAFDMQRSGARLAWDWFFPDEPLPRAIAHVEDQDLWRFALPGTRAYCRALRGRPFDFAAWDDLVMASGLVADPVPTAAYARMLQDGEAIDAFFAQTVTQLAAGPALPVRLRGAPIDADEAARHGVPTVSVGATTHRAVDGLCVNANALFASELGEALARRCGTFGMTWQLRGDGRVKASLRGTGGVDVATIAEQYGGGGHPNSAGITFDLDEFYGQVLKASSRR